MVERLEKTPWVGSVYTTLDDRELRRVLLRKSQQHVYYWVDQPVGEVVLYTIWGVLRGDPRV